MRKAGIKVRSASPDFLDLASPNMDRIMVGGLLFMTRVYYQCEVRLALRLGIVCTVATSVGIHTVFLARFAEGMLVSARNNFPQRRNGAKEDQREAAQSFGIKM